MESLKSLPLLYFPKEWIPIVDSPTARRPQNPFEPTFEKPIKTQFNQG